MSSHWGIAHRPECKWANVENASLFLLQAARMPFVRSLACRNPDAHGSL